MARRDRKARGAIGASRVPQVMEEALEKEDQEAHLERKAIADLKVSPDPEEP